MLKIFYFNTFVRACENNKCLKSIAEDLVITCDWIIDVVATSFDMTTSFSDKKLTYKGGELCLLVVFFINYYITVIINSIYYCYHYINHRAIQKQVLPLHEYRCYAMGQPAAVEQKTPETLWLFDVSCWIIASYLIG